MSSVFDGAKGASTAAAAVTPPPNCAPNPLGQSFSPESAAAEDGDSPERDTGPGKAEEGGLSATAIAATFATGNWGLLNKMAGVNAPVTKSSFAVVTCEGQTPEVAAMVVGISAMGRRVAPCGAVYGSMGALGNHVRGNNCRPCEICTNLWGTRPVPP